MIGDLEQRIRDRAHKIWESEGQPQGRATAHWQRASAEIAAEDEAPARKTRAKAPAAPKRAAAAKAATPTKSRKTTK
jgi:hypothetical protein